MHCLQINVTHISIEQMYIYEIFLLLRCDIFVQFTLFRLQYKVSKGIILYHIKSYIKLQTMVTNGKHLTHLLKSIIQNQSTDITIFENHVI